jgi:carbon storage regulator
MGEASELPQESEAPACTAMLVLARRVGEGIMVGHDVRITVLAVVDGVVKIGIDAPKDVDVHRNEVYIEIQDANIKAPRSAKSPEVGRD